MALEDLNSRVDPRFQPKHSINGLEIHLCYKNSNKIDFIKSFVTELIPREKWIVSERKVKFEPQT